MIQANFECKNGLFNHGQIKLTDSVNEIDANTLRSLLSRHTDGLYGDVDEDIVNRNDCSISNGVGVIYSEFLIAEADISILTYDDQSQTLICLRSELYTLVDFEYVNPCHELIPNRTFFNQFELDAVPF